MSEIPWSVVPLEWRMETTIGLCRVALHSPDPDEQVKEFVEDLGDAEPHIKFVLYAWSQIRTMPAFMCEMEISKVSRLLREARDGSREPE